MDEISLTSSSGIARRRFLMGAGLGAGAWLAWPGGARAASAAEIDRDVDQALQQLEAHSPNVAELIHKSKAVLVFPSIVKGGLLMVGGQYGDGALRRGGKTVAYYNISAASFGLQLGGQTFAYALIFMKQSALDYLRKSSGWAVGSGPSVVVLDEGAAKSTTSTTVTQDVVAVPFSQEGLMAGLGIEGSKITRIKPDR
jgi:lipid-binding SYLF domain-containing protein